MSPERIATYRLQLRPGFGFAQAAAVVPYLARLGVSHLYCSPIGQAAPGSEHGYDVVDPSRINEELGGAERWRTLVRAVREHGMHILLDIVPNHMAIHPANPWWQDVLRHGALSRFAHYFDVDWDPPNGRYSNQVLLPVLGDHYGRVLEAGELVLARDASRFELRYHEHVFPIDPASLQSLLAPAAEAAGSTRLAYLANAFARLAQAATAAERLRDVGVLETLFDELLEYAPLAAAIDDQVALMNSDADRLDELLQRQNYRLAFWRTAGQELGYRRFFDIQSLAGIRVENEEVFAAVHVLPLQLFTDDALDGLRVDHPDGLRDPAGYFRRLRESLPHAWLLAEKILMPGENLPADWPVDGTTGYEFLDGVTGLFVDSEGLLRIDRFYREFTGNALSFEETTNECKRLIAGDVLGSELNRLVEQFARICEQRRRHRDYTRHDIAAAIIEYASAFPVYRNYVRRDDGAVSDADRHHAGAAMECATRRREDIDPELFRFLRDVTLLRASGEREGEFAMRFQQFTSPLMAKGLEDTALFRFNRLIACNEVGSDPGEFVRSPADFHHACERVQREWPETLLATDTHDSKCSGDVHTRLAVLSEVPGRWLKAVREWSQRFRGHHRNGFPDRETEYLFYQVVVGAWPIDEARVQAFMQKAVREAKRITSWLQPDAEYEHALQAFIHEAMSDSAFTESIEDFVADITPTAQVNSLAQTLLKLTAPGVPDIYQGTELQALSLVDPDNRRDVDFDLRDRLLETIESEDLAPGQVLQHATEGFAKLWLIRRVLALRRRRPASFDARAAYLPLETQGACAGRAMAFMRAHDIAVVVPRLVHSVADWGDTMVVLPEGRWRHAFDAQEASGGRIPVSELFRHFPVALLTREGGEG